jgi:hypothetical protein
MKLSLILLLSSLLASSSSFAAAVHSDPEGDVDHNIKGLCHDLSTDMVQTRIEELENDYRVTIQVSQQVMTNVGYREYYFWIDSNPAKAEGYQPYAPESVAWPDLYAKYRIYASFDANNDEHIDEKQVFYQDCLQDDCTSEDQQHSGDIDVQIQGDTVVFTWPKSMIPALGEAKYWKVGYTTYYEQGACNGEDDSPQWGERAFDIKLPISD